MNHSRRRFLAGAGALLTAGLAGCSALDPDVVPPSNLESWLADTENYTEIHDHSGSDSVTVEVGADNGLFFDPAAILVHPGTTVVWEWSGRGGHHDVVEVDGAFESEMTDDADHSFDHTFSEAGVYLYSCRPHDAVGMRGAVVVQE